MGGVRSNPDGRGRPAVGEVYRRGCASPIDDPQQLVDRVVEVVVDQHVVGQFEAHRLLRLGLAQTIGDLVLAVATLAQPALLLGPRRWQDEDQDRLGSLGLDLLGSVDLDLQHDVAAGDGLGERRAVEVAEELGPLQKATGGDVAAKLIASDEVIRRVGLADSAFTCRPGSRQPQLWITADEPVGDRALADASRPGDDDGERRTR